MMSAGRMRFFAVSLPFNSYKNKMATPSFSGFSGFPEFPDLTNATHFPIPESSCLEFKESYGAASAGGKLIPTLCGILNAGGGYMVIGVRDSDLALVGINPLHKDHDRLLLQLDNILHGHLIRDHNEPSRVLPHTIIRTHCVKTKGGKNLLVITATAEAGKLYEVSDGTVWHRLNASNFPQTLTRALYSQQQVNSLVANAVAVAEAAVEGRMRGALCSAKAIAENTQRTLKSEFSALMTVSKKMECELIECRAKLAEAALFARILEEKAKKEAEGPQKGKGGASLCGYLGALLCF